MNTLVARERLQRHACSGSGRCTPGIMVDRSTMIATPETLYLADDKSCKLLDAATGEPSTRSSRRPT